MYKYSCLTILKVAFIFFILFLMVTIVFPQSRQENKGKVPGKGISIVLSVYSGHPNPQWFLTEGPEFDKLVRLLKEIKVEDKELFKYSKWNRLGYASFWIIPKNIEGVPYTVHIWRDEANVVQVKKEKANQAVGVMPIYDMLVTKALKTLKKDQKTLFTNYLKFKAAKEKKEKQKE
ncbi:MAG: hypothetical protein ACFFDN_25650 [Candidatus Hodarchaeota archaeon]